MSIEEKFVKVEECGSWFWVPPPLSAEGKEKESEVVQSGSVKT